MLIDVYSVMHNEEVLLPYWLRHYETVADRIFVWEDQSTDNTRQILAHHPKVTFLPTDCKGDDDPCWITKLFPQYEQVSRGVADWVMIADADEFIYHPQLREVLQKEKDIGTEVILCQGYAMVSDNLPVGDGQIYDEIMLGLPDSLESKWTIHSPDVYIRYHKGRHGKPMRNKRGGANRASGIKLLHYRYLGDQYFEQRDKTNLRRLGMVFETNFPYSRNWRRTLPDMSRGSALDWYAENKAKAVNVL
jgi:hypothetical protein